MPGPATRLWTAHQVAWTIYRLRPCRRYGHRHPHLTLIATRGHDALPLMMEGGNYLLLVKKGISPAVWALTLVGMILLWRREQRVTDLWQMLLMWIWLFDIALSAVIGSNRFDPVFFKHGGYLACSPRVSCCWR